MFKILLYKFLFGIFLWENKLVRIFHTIKTYIPTKFDDLFSIVFTIKFLLRNMISYNDMILLKLYIRYLHSVWIIWTNYSVIKGKRAFQGKKTSKYLFVRVIFLVSKDRSKSTKGGGPSPLNISNMPYFLRRYELFSTVSSSAEAWQKHTLWHQFTKISPSCITW